MRKVLAISFLALLMCSCVQPSQTATEKVNDSVAVADVDKQDAQKMNNTIFAHVADSIFKLHPGDIKNQIIQEDIAKDAEKYCRQFKGRHMPLLEELSFELTDVVQEGSKYAACFKFEREEDEKNLGLEVQLLVYKSREEAAKLYQGKTYTVKGIMAGFPYSTAVLHPNVVLPLDNYDKPMLSLGCIKVDDAELTLK